MKLTKKQKRVIELTKQLAALVTDKEIERLAWDCGTLTILEAAVSLASYQLTKGDEPTEAEQTFIDYALEVMDKVLYADPDEVEEED